MGTKTNRWKPGVYVVYRLASYCFPRLGKLERQSDQDDREKGCWLVRNDADGRLYAIEPSKGATMRAADVGDIMRFRRSKQKDRDREVEAMSVLDLGNTTSEPVRRKPRAVKGVGDSLADAVEQKLANKKGANDD